MKNKYHTLNKLDAQVHKIRFLQRQIEAGLINGPDAIANLEQIARTLESLHERLDLEPNE